jgi:large subunit ribosomal protein L31e
MADAGEEQVYVIPLRGVKFVPRWLRSKRAVKEVFNFLEQHTKTDRSKIRLDTAISEKIWERGSQKPPSKIRIRTMKFADGVLEAELASD